MVVRGGEALGDLTADLEHFGQRQHVIAFETFVERFTAQELHGEKWSAAVFAHLIDADDVVVLERRRRPCLAQKAFLRRRAGRH